MHTGVVFPQTEIGNDPGAIRTFAQAVEELGYAHLVAFDHVLVGEAEGRSHPMRYSSKDAFHEVLVLFGFLAAVTRRLSFAPAIVILPQRQTVLVAKQAAEVDVLTGGRFRMGAGLGWNTVEYEALGENFKNRARRIEEQLEVLRLLWTRESVTYRGRWHTIDRAGLNPMPVQRPIPIWMGGNADAAVRRIARLADGWFTHLQPDDAGRKALEDFRRYCREAGRGDDVPVEGRVFASRSKDPAGWARTAEAFRAMGLSHLEFSTMGAGFKTLDDHLAAMRRFREIAPVFD